MLPPLFVEAASFMTSSGGSSFRVPYAALIRAAARLLAATQALKLPSLSAAACTAFLFKAPSGSLIGRVNRCLSGMFFQSSEQSALSRTQAVTYCSSENLEDVPSQGASVTVAAANSPFSQESLRLA